MDFKDFKSSCRALITSEVGSIPTRSRHSQLRPGGARALGLLLGICLAWSSAAPRSRAEEPPVRVTSPAIVVSPGRSTSSPPATMFRSLAFPGWGQLENGQPYKAGLVFVAETGLLAAGYVELMRSERSRDAEQAASGAGDAAAAAEHYERYLDRRDRAISRFWWSGFAILLSMLDAYTEAHLRDFVSADVPTDLETPTRPTPESAPGPAPAPPAAPAPAPADSAGSRPVSDRLDSPRLDPTLLVDPMGMRLGVALSF